MRLKGIFVACCLLVFLAVVHGEAGHDETEHVDDDQEYELDRERREAGDTETNVDGPAVEKGEGEVIHREKRHLRDWFCGGCHTSLPQPPCHKLKLVKVRVKRRCGWWRRRHTCYKMRWRLRMTRYCCKNRDLVKLVGKVLKMCVSH